MLFLIDADGHVIRLIQQNIRRHEHGIIHEPHVDIIGMLLRFILKLRHALHFPHVGERIQHPRKFGVRRDIGLHVQRAMFGIDPASDVERRKFKRTAPKLARLLPHGDRVQIGDRIKTVVLFLHAHPITDRARIVADGEISARLRRRIYDFSV